MTLVLLGAAAEADPGSTGSTAPGGLRTDRLSRKQLQTWRKIVDIVLAEDDAGQPLHPTLRGLWDTVQAGAHAIYVEMPNTRSYFAGRFEVTRVDPRGRAHEGRLLLNLRAIDRASTGPAATRANGLTPFKELDREGRYAEVLGHELAHAAWHLADPEQAHIAMTLQSDMEQAMQRLRRHGADGADPGLQDRVRELHELAAELEEHAEVTELLVWQELKAGLRHR